MRCFRFSAGDYQVLRVPHPWESRGDRAGLVAARNSCLQADVSGEPTSHFEPAGGQAASTCAALWADPEVVVCRAAG